MALMMVSTLMVFLIFYRLFGSFPSDIWRTPLGPRRVFDRLVVNEVLQGGRQDCEFMKSKTLPLGVSDPKKTSKVSWEVAGKCIFHKQPHDTTVDISVSNQVTNYILVYPTNK